MFSFWSSEKRKRLTKFYKARPILHPKCHKWSFSPSLPPLFSQCFFLSWVKSFVSSEKLSLNNSLWLIVNHWKMAATLKHRPRGHTFPLSTSLRMKDPAWRLNDHWLNEILQSAPTAECSVLKLHWIVEPPCSCRLRQENTLHSIN